MSIKSIALAGAALFALSAGISVAQADEQDDEVRQLNIQQLEQARGDSGADTTIPESANEPDGQGGPELQGPPSPDEGMDDDEDTADEPAADDEPVPQGPEDDDQPE